MSIDQSRLAELVANIDTDYAQDYRIIHEDLGDLRAFVSAAGTMEQA